MLDRLLEFGWRSPALSVTLEFAPPISWIRLAQCARKFRSSVLSDGDVVSHVTAAISRKSRELDICGDFGDLHSGADVGGGWSLSLHAVLDEDCCSHDFRVVLSGADAELQCSESIFIALLSGADVNEVQHLTGLTPLMRVAEQRWLRPCSLLLSRRADANRLSVGDSSALSLALAGPVGCTECLFAKEHGMRCRCPQPALAMTLLRHTNIQLVETCASAIRLALQDTSSKFLSIIAAFVQECGVCVDAAVSGPDSRQGTLLSVALESPVLPSEAPIAAGARHGVVSQLLSLRADPQRRGPYLAWWGGKPADNLIAFAVANGCDEATLELMQDGHLTAELVEC